MAQALRQQAGARAARPAARIWLALGTVYILWGSTYLGIKYAIETIPPLMMGSPGSGHINLFGAALALAAPLCWASGSVFTRHVKLPVRPLVAAAMEMLWAGLLFGIASILTGELGRVHWQQVSTTSLVALLYLIVFGSLVGFSASVWLLRSAPLSLVSTYAYVNPVVAVILGAVFVGEAINARLVIAGGIIILAVALIVVARNRAASQARLAVSA